MHYSRNTKSALGIISLINSRAFLNIYFICMFHSSSTFVGFSPASCSSCPAMLPGRVLNHTPPSSPLSSYVARSGSEPSSPSSLVLGVSLLQTSLVHITPDVVHPLHSWSFFLTSRFLSLVQRHLFDGFLQ